MWAGFYPNRKRNLEGELQSQFDNTLTAFGQNLTEVVNGVRREAEALARITHVTSGSAITIGERLRKRYDRAIRPSQRLIGWRSRTRSIQCQEDVAVGRILVINILRKCLIEDIEETGAELQALGFTNLEVLEQRNIPVRATWRAEVEWRNRRPSSTKGWEPDGTQVENSIANLASAN